MADKLTKESVKKVSTPEKTDTKQAPSEIKMEEVKNPVKSPADTSVEAMKAELRKEIYGEMGAEEIYWMRTSVQGSKETAERLNAMPRVAAMWELDMGEKVGAIDELTINGAVAQVPKGKSVLICATGAKMMKGYQDAEKTAGDSLVNQQGGVGLRADRDGVAKELLGM